jgi:hypothetical protein
MSLYQGRFLISRGGDDGDVWAEGEAENIVLYRGDSRSAESDGVALVSVRHDQFGRLAAWADPETLSVGFTGVLARQIRDLAKEVGLTPQNFVLEALNAFIQAGEMAAGHGHDHGGPTAPPQGQSIEFEGP